jgi:hypothetical protein
VEKVFGCKRDEVAGEYRKLHNGKSVILIHQVVSE